MDRVGFPSSKPPSATPSDRTIFASLRMSARSHFAYFDSTRTSTRTVRPSFDEGNDRPSANDLRHATTASSSTLPRWTSARVTRPDGVTVITNVTTYSAGGSDEKQGIAPDRVSAI